MSLFPYRRLAYRNCANRRRDKWRTMEACGSERAATKQDIYTSSWQPQTVTSGEGEPAKVVLESMFPSALHPGWLPPFFITPFLSQRQSSCRAALKTLLPGFPALGIAVRWRQRGLRPAKARSAHRGDPRSLQALSFGNLRRSP